MKIASKWGTSLTVVALAAVLAACGGDGNGDGSGDAAADGDQDEPIELRAGTGLSAQHAWWEATMVPWMERVEELTDGQVTFTEFTGGELVDVPDEIDAIKDGTIDVTLMLPIYLPGQYPLAEVTMLPISHSDVEIASQAWRDLLESDEELIDGQSYYESQFGQDGLHGWAVSTTEEYAISTTGVEFDSVGTVQGLSLRTPSRIHEMYAGNVGIDSVTIPAVEMFDALSRGAFDGSFYSVADWSGYGFQDLFMYTLTDINFGHFNALIGMTEDTWEGLPEHVQDAMDQAHDDIFMDGAREWIERSDEMREYNTGEGGTFESFDDLDPEVQDHLVGGVEDTWMDYIDLLEQDGLPGTEVAIMWRDILVENGGEVPDAIAELE
jgi:TRAP-type C4-dicarboxylate transport system substrate-binding protein